MPPIQQMFLGMPSGSKIYVDTVFDTVARVSDGNTYVNSSGLDLSTEGGLVWTKSRSNNSTNHIWHDSIRGSTYSLSSDNANGSNTGWAGANTFTSTGYSIAGGDGTNNASGYTYVDWAFRKSAGFFDVIQFSGSGSEGHVINHNLGCKPGMIILKRTDTTSDWFVWHKDMTSLNHMLLNNTNAQSNAFLFSGDSDMTATTFRISVGGASQSYINQSGSTWMAYLFAEGESDVGNTSVEFGGNDNLTINQDSTMDIGSNDFTMECWIKVQTSTSPGNYDVICASELYLNGSGNSFSWYAYNNGGLAIFRSASGSWVKTEDTGLYSLDTWTHVAWVRSGSGTNNNKVYVNGTKQMEFTDTMSYSSNQKFYLGASDYSQNGTPNEYGLTGNISNFRFTNGQALYTSDFTPSTTPLTTTSQGATAGNVAVLCCNATGASGYTKIPTDKNISLVGDTVSSTDSPFTSASSTDAAALFGGSKDKGIVKTGSYLGNGSSTGPVIDLGWEPQWILIKNATGTSDWTIFDSTRGIITDGGDNYLHPNSTDQETENLERVDLTSRGFKITDSGWINNNGDTYVYMAIRMSDGAVGKPAEAGTDVFALDVGNSSTTVPCFDSGFPVDMAFRRAPAGTSEWWCRYRKMYGDNGLQLDIDSPEQSGFGATYKFANSVGWASHMGSNYQSWMWKRGQGFDVIFYDGNSQSPRTIKHSLNQVPEMYWVKRRTGGSGDKWAVYHSALGNTKYLRVNTTQYAYTDAIWNNTSPTSTEITLGTDAAINTGSGGTYVAMLFSSVTGISKCGSYTGTANSAQSISLGFQPRFLIIKNATGTANNWTTGWFTYDTLRGWSSPNTTHMFLNDQMANQTSNGDCAPTSTGFDITAGSSNYINNNGDTYVYYAHA